MMMSASIIQYTSLAATYDVALYAAGVFMLSRAKLKRTALFNFFTPGRLASASKVDGAHVNDLRFLILSSRWLAGSNVCLGMREEFNLINVVAIVVS